MQIAASITQYPLRKPFSIARGVRTHQNVVEVVLRDGEHAGRGAASGLAYRGETPTSLLMQLESIFDELNAGADRAALQELLPPGGARAALDAAFWELEAARANCTVRELLEGAAISRPLVSAYTIVLDTPDAMAAQAAREAGRPLLKVKLGGDAAHEAARIRAVRRAAPDARLIADANAGWSPDNWLSLARVLAENRFELLEQPLAVGLEEALDKNAAPLPLCADESLNTRAELPRIARHFHLINIKLDKAGGLTEGLALRDAARAMGLGVFVGCMLGPARAIAPAHLLAQTADYADLDGPFWFAGDPGVELDAQQRLMPVDDVIWGRGEPA